MTHYKHQDLTKEIINAFYKVYNTLGYGFLEKVYENALSLELQKRGLKVTQQAPVTVFYDGEPVGHYVADIVINDLVILEIKSAETIVKAHEAQLLNYLRATNIEVGLVLNFGPRPEISRKVYETARHRKPSNKS
jgi:GxxExxY protein